MIEFAAPSGQRPYAVFAADGRADPLAVEEGAFIAAFKQFGAVLLRGFAIDLERFRAFAERYCQSSVFNESPDRKVLDAAHNVQTVNGGSEPFPLHPELSREPWKPDVCMFWCASPPASGGETTICDGVAIVRELPAPVRAALAPRRLLYVQQATPEACAYWLGAAEPDDAALRNPPPHCPYQFSRVGGRIVRAFSRPALHKPMFSDELAFGNFLFFARYHNAMKAFPVFENGQPVPDALLDEVKAVADRLTAPIAWRAGDLLVLDNTRFMHGRNAIEDTQARAIASYFGYLRFAQPDAEELPDAPWRRAAFRPPVRSVAFAAPAD